MNMLCNPDEVPSGLNFENVAITSEIHWNHNSWRFSKKKVWPKLFDVGAQVGYGRYETDISSAGK